MITHIITLPIYEAQYDEDNHIEFHLHIPEDANDFQIAKFLNHFDHVNTFASNLAEGRVSIYRVKFFNGDASSARNQQAVITRQKLIDPDELIELEKQITYAKDHQYQVTEVKNKAEAALTVLTRMREFHEKVKNGTFSYTKQDRPIFLDKAEEEKKSSCTIS